MSSDNKEFPIPFEESRRGAPMEQDEKAAAGRLGRYLASRAIDRPTIGDRRRGRGRDRVDLPTGGKPGTRRPTGSRRDPDGDGWADEGTTKPVWVGLQNGDKPTTKNREKSKKDHKLFPNKTSREIPDGQSRLASGRSYEELVDRQPELSEENKARARRLIDMLRSDELKNPDSYREITDPFGDVDDVIDDSPERLRVKEQIIDELVGLLGGELELERDVVVTAANGEKINIGKKLLISHEKSFLGPTGDVSVMKVREEDLKEQEELGLYVEVGEKDGVMLTASITLLIKPTPEAIKKIQENGGLPESMLPWDIPKDADPAEYAFLGRASRMLVFRPDKEDTPLYINHESLRIDESAQGQGIGAGFNARNEKVYEALGADMILTMGMSDEVSNGAVFWGRNGFEFGGEKSKQDALSIINSGIKNAPEARFSEEDKKRISSLFRKNEATGKFETEASAEELLDFEHAESLFQAAEAQIMYMRPLKSLVDSGSKLSSGKPPSYPREPTYGAFLGSADEIFRDIDSWEQFKDLYNDREVVFFDYETTGLVFDEFRRPSSKGAPVQFGAVKIKNGKEVGRINLFMNPNEELGEWSRNNLKDIDGNPLTDEWLSQQMSIEDAHRQLIEFAGPDALFGVQNASFDKDVLDGVLAEMGEEWRPSGWLDTREIAALTLPKWTPETDDGPFITDREGNKKPSSSLAAITEYLGVELGDGHHNADVDAFATSEVMRKLIDGAIEKGWSKDALDKEKRDSLHKATVDKFNSEIVQFEKDRESFIAAREDNQTLSSGRQRPLIPMRKIPERKPAESGNRGVKGYGQADASGKEVRRSSTKWLAGMTSEEMSRVLVPSSKEEHFEMWADDLAGTGWRNSRKYRKFLKEYYTQLDGHENALRIDYSPEGLEASRELVRSMLDSSPQMKWMFENFGAPLVGVFTRDAMNEYENRPDVKERFELLRQQRNMQKTPFVSGLASREFGFIGLTPRALIDRESYDDGDGGYPLELDPNRKPQPRDAHVDRSLHGTLIHEYGHWLHYRAVRDLETNGSAGSKSYYGSGRMDDPMYRSALDVAEEYANPDTDNEAIEIYSSFIDLTGRDAEEMFKAHPDKALTATSYGNVNKREAIAEAFVAIMHPNTDLAKSILSPKLRRDIYALAGVDPENLPWEKADSNVRLSSGTRTKPQRQERRGRIARALRQLVGSDGDGEPREKREEYTFEPPERPEGLVSFAAEPSNELRKSLPIPTETDLAKEIENDVTLIPVDPILEKLGKSLGGGDIPGFGVGMFASLEDRKASASAKRMISLNIAETSMIEPREFIEAFDREQAENIGLTNTSALRFFGEAENSRKLRDIFKAIDAASTDEEKSIASRFALDRKSGTIVSVKEHERIIAKREAYDKIIDVLEEKSFEELFGDEWEKLTEISAFNDDSVFTPYLFVSLGGNDIQQDLLQPINGVRGMLNDMVRALTIEDDYTEAAREAVENISYVFSPIGDINPRTGKPNMALVAERSQPEVAKALRLLVNNGELVSKEDRTPEQVRAYDTLIAYGKNDDYLQRIAKAGLFSVDSSNANSEEVKELMKTFLVERMRARAGNAEQFRKEYEYTSGVSFLDINTPEGIREARAAIISDIIHTWAISANNSNPVALSLQHEARQMFGLDEAVGWSGGVREQEGIPSFTAVPASRKGSMTDAEFDDAPDITPEQRKIIRSVVSAIYDATQHYYKSKGITHVAVWRGMRDTDMRVGRGEISADTSTMRPLSSWTTNGTMAKAFATTVQNKTLSEDEQQVLDGNILIKAFVPVENVFSNPLTGFGCLGEDEVVLLGRPTQVLAITPPANVLPDLPEDGASDSAKEVLQQVIDASSERDKLTSKAFNRLASLDFESFKQEFASLRLNPRTTEPRSTSGQSRLSSGKVIKYNAIDVRMRASDMRVTFERDKSRVDSVKSTLTKGFMGGFTVEVDRMDDIKSGVAIARNKHGMKVDAVADFDAEGNPSQELVNTFLAWMDFHGPKTFNEPKPGADKATIGGWVSDGTLYLDVVDVYPNTEENLSRAADMGKSEDQIAVTNLDKLWELLEKGEDVSPAFIDSGGTGGFTLDEQSVKRVSAAISELNSNKANTGSRLLKRIGNTKTFTDGPVTAARRVRHTDFETGEKNDYWVISTADGLVKVFTQEQYLKARDKKIQDLVGRMSKPSDIFESMVEAAKLKPVASMSFSGGKRVGKPVISRKHKNRGLSLSMANLYGFANNLETVGVAMGDKVVAA